MTITNPKRLGALALVGGLRHRRVRPQRRQSAAPSAASTAPSTAPGSAPASEAATSLLPACLSFADIYSLVGPESTGFANWTDGQEIATALGSTTTFPDAPLSITAPGEESGTFDSFVELVLEGPAEARGIPEDRLDDPPRLHQQLATTTRSSRASAAPPGRSAGSASPSSRRTSTRSVRSRSPRRPAAPASTPTAETIASNEYPISRDLYIYVNKAKAAANPAVVAYVDYYLADGTIDTALETVPYVNLLGDALAETAGAWTTGKPGAAADPNGTIFVSGSSTVEPISNAVAEAFKAANAGFDYTVEGPAPVTASPSSAPARPTSPMRRARSARKRSRPAPRRGIEYVELKVAIDGIAVITQK